MIKIAIIQQPPVLLDKEKSLQKAVDLIEEAVGSGAELIVFPETFIPGYPDWIWRLRPKNDNSLINEIHESLMENSINLKSNDLQPLFDIAKKYHITIK